MIPRFEFNTVGRIIFGIGEFKRVGEIARSMGANALVLHNAPALVEPLVAQLAAAGVGAIARVQPGEPVVNEVDANHQLAVDYKCDVVIGLGGGSAIDAAKAVAGLLGNGGAASDYMEVVGKSQKIARPAAPWIAIPTTAGTGAEATRNAVIGYPEKRFKASIRSEYLLARVALIDPELGVGVPPPVTAASGMDALCQVIESYTSSGASAMTDPLALQGITLAARSLRRAYHNGADLDARADMAMAAYLSGVTLTNAGLGAVHGFAAPLGANFPVPHGVVCAALLPHVIKANVRALSADPAKAASLARYAAVGRLLAGKPDLGDEQAVKWCAAFTAELAQELRIPPLSQYGMTANDVPSMVALAKKASSMRYNPVTLPDDALAEVLLGGIQG